MRRITLAAALFAAIAWVASAPAQLAGGLMFPGPGTPTQAPATAQSFITASVAEQYLTTTWSHAPTDATKATVSYWIKYIVSPSAPDTFMFTTAISSLVIFDHQYNTSSFKHEVKDVAGGAYSVSDFLIAPDMGVWHHVCLQIDTNQATAANRIQIYVDGVLGTDPPATPPVLGSNMQITANTIVSYIGEIAFQVGTSSGIPDAKFAYFYLIDGQALTPASFMSGGHPITYSGTYGNNGFFLNGNGGTSGGVPDQSGNSNNWTAPNSITYSADVPT